MVLNSKNSDTYRVTLKVNSHIKSWYQHVHLYIPVLLIYPHIQLVPELGRYQLMNRYYVTIQLQMSSFK